MNSISIFSIRRGSAFNTAKRLCAVAAALLFAGTGVAQNPFAQPPGGAPGGGNPFAVPGAAPPPPTVAPAGAKADAEEDPLVRQILESQPQTRDQLMSALRHFVNLGRGDRAKEMIAKLDALGLDNAGLAELERQFGGDLFVELSLKEKYAPEGREFAQKVLAAAKQRVRDPQRIAQLIDQLASEDSASRATAVADLRMAGRDAIAPLAQALADTSRKQQHELLERGMAGLGAYVAPAMAAMLEEAPDAALRVRAANVLGRLRAHRELPAIVGALHDPQETAEVRRAAARAATAITGRVPSLDESTTYLRQRARHFADGGATLREDLDGLVAVWVWDAKQNLPTELRVPRQHAGWRFESRIMSRLFRISPDNIDWRREHLISQLTVAKLTGGLDTPVADPALRQLCQRLGHPALEDAFVLALERERLLAAAGAAELLGELGDASLVMAGGGRPRALVKAVTHGDRRVQFAALEAIMRLDPQRAYRGASWTTKSLGFFAASSGTPRVLVGHPSLDQGMTWVGMLEELGWRGDVVHTGRQLADQAPRTADYDLILVHERLGDWRLDEALQRLREHPTVKTLPIGLICEPGRLKSIQIYGLKDAKLLPFARPFTTPHMHRIVTSLSALRTHPPVDSTIRMRWSSTALNWMDRLTRNRYQYTFYDFHTVREALNQGLGSIETAPTACHVLGRLGTPEAQRTLVGLASTHLLPLPIRQAAAESFQTAVERKGMLLTRPEIHRQYDLYNRTEKLDRPTQQVMGSILDVIESQR